MVDYAVNVADMVTHKDHLMLALLLGPVIREGCTADCEPKRIDGMGVVLICSGERAAAICRVIRLKLDRRKIRLYERRKTAWRRMP